MMSSLAQIHIFSFQCYRHHRDLHSFPTRRSSDLEEHIHFLGDEWAMVRVGRLSIGDYLDTLEKMKGERTRAMVGVMTGRDRKSTRLNSSHMSISYAVFCLKKKKKQQPTT